MILLMALIDIGRDGYVVKDGIITRVEELGWSS
jgi:hypothetical protein